mgnify:CR=1 FL=1
MHTERLIQHALDKIVSGRTTFLISNRFHTVARADQILVFKDGRITQRGVHRDLVKAEGEYRELYTSQMRPLEEARLGGTKGSSPPEEQEAAG